MRKARGTGGLGRLGMAPTRRPERPMKAAEGRRHARPGQPRKHAREKAQPASPRELNRTGGARAHAGCLERRAAEESRRAARATLWARPARPGQRPRQARNH